MVHYFLVAELSILFTSVDKFNCTLMVLIQLVVCSKVKHLHFKLLE